MERTSGIELARGFFTEVVQPLLARERPGLRYAAGRLGSGSDVLGLDDETSRDHDWGCRLTVLVDEADRAEVAPLDDLLERALPPTYLGWPVRFGLTWEPAVRHQVRVATVGGFAIDRLGVDPATGMSTLDWLVLPGQRVLEVIAGPLFVDATNGLGPLRETLRWYPSDVDKYVLAAGWECLSEFVPVHGRVAERGQHLQSRRLAATMVGEVVRLAFLVGRFWPPYEKWFEALFHRLPVAADLTEPLETMLTAADWREREAALARAVDVLLTAQRARGLSTPGHGLVPFHTRAQRMVSPDIAARLLDSVTDPAVRALPARLGTIEQWAARYDVVFNADRRPAIVDAYRAWMATEGVSPITG